MTTLSELTPNQIRALIKIEHLGGGIFDVGCQAYRLAPRTVLGMVGLIEAGLVEEFEGPTGGMRFRLTIKGMAVRELGAA
ncbi:hypothetical protein [Aureimonas sp. D3]|uniref:hypothetical protein n=1 Tax=Aureimonas sp. D3 TaxID=1638164 RepID=UPI000782A70A|nr:hypothetical protein [Aureimonas sp. D3]